MPISNRVSAVQIRPCPFGKSLSGKHLRMLAFFMPTKMGDCSTSAAVFGIGLVHAFLEPVADRSPPEVVELTVFDPCSVQNETEVPAEVVDHLQT